MSSCDKTLIKWAEKGQRPSVTLGQLVTLLELSGRESVAAMAPDSASNAVNFRQKLDRLEKALSVGRLTRRVGNVTQVNETGRRVAGEVRLLLTELGKRTTAAGKEMVWIFGAGDTWLQSVIIPTLARWPSGTTARWQVANLQSRPLCDALREGRVHFGLLRIADLAADSGLDEVRVFTGVGLSVVMSGAPAFATLQEAVGWAIRERHPLIQQGSSWSAFRKTLAEYVGEEVTASLEAAVTCETHPQAAGSVANGRGWTVVPSIIARNVERSAVVVWQVSQKRTSDDVVLVKCSRVLDKFSGGTEAANALKREIGLTIAGVKK